MTVYLLLTALFAGQPPADLRFTAFEYKDFDRGELSTATVTFRRGLTEVALVSVVHIADSGYYREIQRDLNSYDLVFYEMVSGSSPQALSTLSALQLAAGRLLRLSFQVGEIDYQAANLVHADLSWSQIERLLGGVPFADLSDEKVLGKFIPRFRRAQEKGDDYFAENPALRRSIKVFLGQLLGDIPAVLAQLNSEAGHEGDDILIAARNRRAMETLIPYLQGRKKLALFWGAAHMPDFARRLRQRGFVVTDVQWYVAWKIGPGPEQRWF